MILIVLLLVAVVSLVLGLALANAIWLIVSLVASALAAVVLYLVVRGQRTRKPGPAAEPALADAIVASRTEADLAKAELAMAGARTRSGSGSTGYGGKERAVTLNKPAGVSGSGTNSANGTLAHVNGTNAAALDQVWVVDGYPEFHSSDCAALGGRSAEPIPHTQAVQDGFEPCSICQSSEPAQVWVADGYPEYHLEQCAELVGLSNEAVPYGQAVEDGFEPCAVCRPDRTGAPRGGS